ncbi:MAG: type ISP restriction/modification enzyme [Dongiaceae bacterium]
MANIFDAYLRKLRETPLSEQTEHTGRSALEALLNEFAAKTAGGNTTVQHEPKRAAGKGAPDFKIKRQGMILGYVETKPIDENLDKVLKSEQIERYKSLSKNIVLTDYLHFIWINKDGLHRETLCHATDLESPRFRPREDRAAAVAKLLEAFFSAAPEGIGRAQALALALATRSKLLRGYLGEELVRQEREHKEDRLFGLFQIFRDQVFHELTLKEFADAFAQMLAYGLFLARLNSDTQAVTLHNAREYVPGSFRLIRELVDFLTELEKAEYGDVRWVIEEVLSIVNGLDLRAIQEDLSFRRRKAVSRKVRAADEEEHRLFERDPFIYFYEDYLRAYDKQTSKSRGVYYTPPPIVNFIVRAVDDILKDSFGIRDGLADHRRVTVLDFACGTGTFLLEVFQRIFDNLGGPDSGRADLIVRDHFLKNIFGFEYLIAPYTIAHLKLSQYLRDQKHPLKDDERLQVFLTNTLEPIEPQANLLLPAVSAEVEAAQAVKEKPILVITGNPPYSGHSKNKGAWITAAIDEYKFTWEKTVDGLDERRPLGEKNPKWLQDDYVKFIRFAQMKMDGFTFRTIAPDGKLIEHSVPGIENGIVGVITNHSWLDNPTFRGMRQSLMRSFERIYVLDLHGSAKKKERAPDGSKDENVFDIEQGVAISLFVKRPGLERGVWRGDLWGKRLDKYKVAAEGTLESVAWLTLEPVAPFYLFARQDARLRDEYQRHQRLTDTFPINVLGFQTHRDAFAVSFTEVEMKRKLKELADPGISDDELERRYGLKSNRGWSLPDVRTAVRSGKATPPQLIAYRPFDNRWSEFSSLTMDRPRRELLDHVAGRANITLLAPRGIGTKNWQHAFIADVPANDCVVSNRSREANQVFPLWRFGNGDTGPENLASDFRAFLDARYEHHYTPEEILGYIYAVLHAPAYRARYAEFLRIDFPRVPFPEAADDFEALSGLGWALVQAHLMRELPRGGLAVYHGKGDHTVETVRYSPQEQAVWINKTQCFEPVPQAVWEFHIGGYQVLDKYLKSRKGRMLSLDEINHFGAVADSLAFTIDRMAAIDAAYRAAFPEQG